MGRNYWMVVESLENFEITKELGFTLHGVGRKYRRRAQRMQPDDRVLYYVTGTRKWTAITTITSHSFEDHTPIWKSNGREDGYPFRVKMAPQIVLDGEDCIDALILAPRLEYVKRWAPEDWHLAFHGNLHLLPQRDFRLIESEMKRNLSKRRKAKVGERSEESDDGPGENPTEAVGQAQTGERSEGERRRAGGEPHRGRRPGADRREVRGDRRRAGGEPHRGRRPGADRREVRGDRRRAGGEPHRGRGPDADRREVSGDRRPAGGEPNRGRGPCADNGGRTSELAGHRGFLGGLQVEVVVVQFCDAVQEVLRNALGLRYSRELLQLSQVGDVGQDGGYLRT